LRGAALREDFAGFSEGYNLEESIAKFEKNNPKSLEEAEARYRAMLDKTAKENKIRY